MPGARAAFFAATDLTPETLADADARVSPAQFCVAWSRRRSARPSSNGAVICASSTMRSTSASSISIASAPTAASSSSTPSTSSERTRTARSSSSRYWFADSYDERFTTGGDPESSDKEYVRRYLAGLGFKGDGPIPAIPDEVRVEATGRYIQAYEKITGTEFVPDTEDPNVRIPRNLKLR